LLSEQTFRAVNISLCAVNISLCAVNISLCVVNISVESFHDGMTCNGMIPVVFYQSNVDMLRLLLILLAAVLVWILFFSSFERRTKIITSVSLFILTISTLWFDSYLSKPKSNKIDIAEVVVCGLDVQYSYRTNYNIELCLKNNHPSVTLRRVAFEITAQVCSSDSECTSLQTNSKSRSVEVPAGSEVTLADSMSFEQVAAKTNAGLVKKSSEDITEDSSETEAVEIVWGVKLSELKAI